MMQQTRSSSEGTMTYVTATQKLYIKVALGWKEIQVHCRGCSSVTCLPILVSFPSPALEALNRFQLLRCLHNEAVACPVVLKLAHMKGRRQ